MDDGGVNLKSAGKKNLPVSPKISFVFRQKNSGINFCAIGVRNAPIKNLNVDAKAKQQTDIFNKAMNIKNCVSVCDVKSAYSQKMYIRASQFFQIAIEIRGIVVWVKWVGCSQILFAQAYFWSSPCHLKDFV